MDRRDAFKTAVAAMAGVALGNDRRADTRIEQFFKGNLTLNEWRKMEGRESIGVQGDARFNQKRLLDSREA